jgi:hypothetical protein
LWCNIAPRAAPTHRRLYALPSPQQIDEAFAHEVRRQYLEVLGEPAPSESSASSATSDVVDQIMMVEREVVMCKVAADLAAAEGGAVALVVGSAHLPGGAGRGRGAAISGCAGSLGRAATAVGR